MGEKKLYPIDQEVLDKVFKDRYRYTFRNSDTGEAQFVSTPKMISIQEAKEMFMSFQNMKWKFVSQKELQEG